MQSLLNKTLIPESRCCFILPLYNFNGVVDRIALSIGSDIRLYNTDMQLLETHPFNNPIAGASPIISLSHAYFVVLRDLKWFIVEDSIVRSNGSFCTPISVPARRYLLPYDHVNDEPSYPNSSVSASLIFSKETSVLVTTHPKYIAVSAINNQISIISVSNKNAMCNIPMTRPNIIDIAFIGPFNHSSRLCVLSDSLNNERIIYVYSIFNNEPYYRIEFTCTLPKDAYKLLPLNAQVESTLLVFTSDGIIRFSCPMGLAPKEEQISAYFEGVVLDCSHFLNDLYVFSDSNGGLFIGKFPVEGRPLTEKLKKLSPYSGLYFINSKILVCANPFGSIDIYSCVLSDDGFSINCIDIIEINGHISKLGFLSDHLCFLSGKGSTCSLKRFHRSIDAEIVHSIHLDGCIDVFSCPYISGTYVCFSFISESRLVIYDNDSFRLAPKSPFIEGESTLLFSFHMDYFVQVTPERLVVFSKNKDHCVFSNTFEFKVVCCSLSENNLCFCCSNGSIKVFNIEILEFIFESYHSVLVYSINIYGDFCIALFENKEIVMIDISKKTEKSIKIPIHITPSSLCYYKDENSSYLYLGTFNGTLVQMDLEADTLNEFKVGSNEIKVKRFESIVFCTGETPIAFIGKEIQYITCGNCFQATFTKDHIICILSNTVSFFKRTKNSQGFIQSMNHVPNTISFFGDCTDSLSFLVNNNDKFYIQDFIENKEKETQLLEAGQVSFIETIEIPEKIILVGFENKTLILMNMEKLIMCTVKTSGIPTSACRYRDFIACLSVNSIELFQITCIDGQYDLEAKLAYSGFAFGSQVVSCLDFLVITDGATGVYILKVLENSIIDVFCDISPKGFNHLAVIDDLIFASTFSSSLYVYRINENGDLYEYGCIQSRSPITSFCVNNGMLFYSTDCGGMYSIIRKNTILPIMSIAHDQRLNIYNNSVPNQLKFYKDNPFVEESNLRYLIDCEDPLILEALNSYEITKKDLEEYLTNT